VLLALPVHIDGSVSVLTSGAMAWLCRCVARTRDNACKRCWLFLRTLMAAWSAMTSGTTGALQPHRPQER